jgi:hypothetical protein
VVKISTPALTGKYRGVLSSAFNQLKYLFTAILLVLSLNAGAVEDAEKFGGESSEIHTNEDHCIKPQPIH